MAPIIHYADDTDFPSVHVACLGDGSPKGSDPNEPDLGIYEMQIHGVGQVFYTFKKDLTSCHACKQTWSVPIIAVDVEGPYDPYTFFKPGVNRSSEFQLLGYPWAPGYRPSISCDGRGTRYTLRVRDRDVARALLRVKALPGILGVKVA